MARLAYQDFSRNQISGNIPQKIGRLPNSFISCIAMFRPLYYLPQRARTKRNLDCFQWAYTQVDVRIPKCVCVCVCLGSWNDLSPFPLEEFLSAHLVPMLLNFASSNKWHLVDCERPSTLSEMSRKLNVIALKYHVNKYYVN